MRLIDADALKKAIDLPFLENIRLGKIINDAPTIEAETKCVARIEVDTEEIVRRIKEEYDIDAEPVRHGRWININSYPYEMCSVCGETHDTVRCLDNYCPNCGADMRGDKHETD